MLSQIKRTKVTTLGDGYLIDPFASQVLVLFDGTSTVNRSTYGPSLVTDSGSPSYVSGIVPNFSMLDCNTAQSSIRTSSNVVINSNQDFCVEGFFLSKESTLSRNTNEFFGLYTSMMIRPSNRDDAIYFGGQNMGVFSSIDLNNVLTHCALTRTSGVVQAWKNGVATGTTLTSNSSSFNNLFNIGAYNERFNGYVGQVRLTVGTSRYGGTAFTPPSKFV
jgi:hypothetical protein